MADAKEPKKPRRDRWRELVEASREQETSSTNEANRADKSRHPRDTAKRERQVTFADLPLFASERDIANALMGPGRYSTWRAIAPLLERRGLPTIDGLMGGRYTPAIRAFFDREYGDPRPGGDVPPRGRWTGAARIIPRSSEKTETEARRTGHMNAALWRDASRS